MPKPIAVTVIGGYLGAGKTTLVNHILRHADQRVAVMVNDFGEVNIDADLIESNDGDTISLANGCICCSMVDGFSAALAAITKATPLPERLVIEASGVGYPGQIAAYAHAPGLSLDGVIAVVDAETFRANLRSEYIGDVLGQQCAEADLIILNKADLAKDVAAVRDLLGTVSNAPVLEAVNAAVSLEVLIGLDRTGTDGGSGPAADVLFRTWVEEYSEPVDREVFLAELAAAKNVVRAKGTVRFTDAPKDHVVVHRVGSRVTTGESGPQTFSRVVFIGLR